MNILPTHKVADMHAFISRTRIHRFQSILSIFIMISTAYRRFNSVPVALTVFYA